MTCAAMKYLVSMGLDCRIALARCLFERSARCNGVSIRAILIADKKLTPPRVGLHLTSFSMESSKSGTTHARVMVQLAPIWRSSTGLGFFGKNQKVAPSFIRHWGP